MKKLLLALFALVSMALAIASCEKKEKEDTTVYCWKVTMVYSYGSDYEMEQEMDLPMTSKEAKELEEKGSYSMNGMSVKVTSVVKQDKSVCGI